LTWQIEWEDKARRELLKLDKQIQVEIVNYLDARIAASSDPRATGKSLEGNLAGLWRYRLRDYRIICSIEDTRSILLVLNPTSPPSTARMRFCTSQDAESGFKELERLNLSS
jgi:mRNA interferase RelE/StbE